MNLSSPWVSLGPLLVFNVVLLGTVLVFRPIYRKKSRDSDIEKRHTSKLLNRWMREYWLWLTGPFVRFFVRHGFTPNTLTVIGVVIAAASAWFFWKGHFGLGGWLMIFGSTFDTFDGQVARATNRETKSGAYFDAVMDRVSEAIVFLGLALFYRSHWGLWIVVAAMVGAFMVSYAKARGDACGVFYSGGSMQRPERIVYLGVGAIFAPVFGWPLAFLTPRIAELLYLIPLGFVAVMCWITAIDRVRHVMQAIDAQSKT